jgi:hypothetical protein
VADPFWVLNQCPRALNAPDDSNQSILVDLVLLKWSTRGGFFGTGTEGEEGAEWIPLPDRVVDVAFLRCDSDIQGIVFLFLWGNGGDGCCRLRRFFTASGLIRITGAQ